MMNNSIEDTKQLEILYDSINDSYKEVLDLKVRQESKIISYITFVSLIFGIVVTCITHLHTKNLIFTHKILSMFGIATIYWCLVSIIFAIIGFKPRTIRFFDYKSILQVVVLRSQEENIIGNLYGSLIKTAVDLIENNNKIVNKINFYNDLTFLFVNFAIFFFVIFIVYFIYCII